MGMYTKLSVNLSFKDNLPKEVVTALKVMVGYEGTKEICRSDLPEHELFNTPRWDFMLRCSSYSHTPFSLAKFHYDDVAERYYLTSSSDFKHYDEEIDLFFDFVKDYVEEGFLGYSLYEEDQTPILYFLKEGNVVNNI